MAFVAPIVGAAAGAVAGIGSTVVGSIALRMVGSIALSAVSQRMQQSRLRSQMAGSTALSGSAADGFWRDQTITAPAQPAELIYGRIRKAGTITFWHDEGPLRYVVVTLAMHQIEAIDEIYFDGELAFDAAGNPQGRFVGFAEVEKSFGRPDENAFPTMRARIPSLWTTEHRMRSVAGLALTLRFDANVYPGGTPNVNCIVRGKNDILDPRTDQRGWSNNAALCLADYMALPTMFGPGATIGAEGGVNADSLIEAANICDEVVARVDGGTEPRYRLDGIVTLSVQPKTIIERMASAMAGDVSYIAGEAHIFAGAYRIPVMDLTLDDARGPLTGASRTPMRENCNAVRGKFRSPENDWQPDDFPPVLSSVYLAEDNGERRFLDIELPFTLSASAAQRLAKIEMEKRRRQITETFPAKLRAMAVAAGDVVTRTDPTKGWVAKPFEVVRMNIEIGTDANGGPFIAPDLVLRETSPLIYDWSASEEQIYEAAPRTNLASAFDIQPPGIVAVVESLYQTRPGDGVKARVDLTLSPSPSVNARGYEVEGRRDDGEWVSIVRNVGETAVELLDAAPGAWEFRARSYSLTGVRSAWSEVYRLTVRGLTAPPSALVGASIMQIGGQALLRWTLPPELDVLVAGHIVIRHAADIGATWTRGLSVAEVSGSSSSAIVPLMPGVYLLRARDSSGNLGPVVTLQADGAQALPFALAGLMQEDDEFAGVQDGTFASGGALQLGSDGDIWASPDLWAEPDLWVIGGEVLPDGTYTFAAGLDLGAVKTVRLRRDVSMIPVRIDDDIWAEPDLWAMADIYGAESDEVDVRVEVSLTPDDPAGSPVWGAWQRLDASEVTARGVRARAILTTTNPLVTPRVTRLRVQADEVAA